MVLSLAAGAVLGRYAPFQAAIAVLAVLLVVSCWRRIVFVAAVALAFGALRGFSAVPEPSTATSSAPRSRPAVMAVLEQTRTRFERAIDRSMPQTEAALLKGILVGSRADLPAKVRNDFRRTGTSHIVAVSGYNVTIVVAALAAMVSFVPLPLTARTVLTVTAIAAFVVLTGSSPSVVRAGIMAGVVVLTRLLGRPSAAGHALLLASALMVLVQPETSTSLSFQLSVAATAGLIFLADGFADRLRFVPEALGVRTSLASTLAATAGTQPLILLAFGQASLVAPLANILILPLVPVAMLLGAIIAAIAWVVPTAAPVVGWVAWLPLAAIVQLAHLVASWPGAGIQAGPLAAVMAATLLAGLVGTLVVRWRKRYGTP